VLVSAATALGLTSGFCPGLFNVPSEALGPTSGLEFTSGAFSTTTGGVALGACAVWSVDSDFFAAACAVWSVDTDFVAAASAVFVLLGVDDGSGVVGATTGTTWEEGPRTCSTAVPH